MNFYDIGVKMNYYDTKTRAIQDINDFLDKNANKSSNVQSEYDVLVIFIVTKYGFSPKFVENYLTLRKIKIENGVLIYGE